MGKLINIRRQLEGKPPLMTPELALERVVEQLQHLDQVTTDTNIKASVAELKAALSIMFHSLHKSVKAVSQQQAEARQSVQRALDHLLEIELRVNDLPQEFPVPKERPRKWRFDVHYDTDGQIEGVTARAIG